MSDNSQLLASIDKELAKLSSNEKLVPLKEVAGIVRSIILSIPQTGPHAVSNSNVDNSSTKSEEANYIKNAIDKLEFHTMRDGLLPKLEQELAAIVDNTARATQTILVNTEEIESLLASLKSKENISESDKSNLDNKLMNAATHIYEACSFQDITGQRMNKIISYLKEIELRIEGLIGMSGDKAAFARYEKIQAALSKRKQDKLLQGPQLEKEATSQADIDKLFT